MIGKQILHYKIKEKLGEGGMGIVYKAEDTKLDRFVALKFLPPHLSRDEEGKQRFINEAKAASALDHPNICTIHEIDETGQGQMFIAMAYYEGETLKEKIERGTIPIDEVVNLAVQIAEGLAKAYAKGIIHRDIKPANILIAEDSVAKIVDFGLAKLAGGTMLTQEGTTRGTVAYMSPEQVQGTEIDHRTDIWSLGVVLYEMVTGHPPFKGGFDQVVIYSIMNEEPASVSELRTEVPAALERIVNRCLAKAPEERYQYMDELVADLQKAQQESGISEQIPAIKVRSPGSPPNRMNRRTVSIGIFFAVLILILGVYFLSDRIFKDEKSVTPVHRQNQWENSIAVLPFENISPDPEQEYFCDGMTEQIITNLSQLEDLKIIARTSVMKFKDSEKTIPEIAEQLQVTHILEGSIRKFENRIRVTAQLVQADEGHHIWANDYDRELQDIFAVQDDISQAIARALLRKLTPKEVQEVKTKGTESAKAYEYYLKGEYFHQKKFRDAYQMKYFEKSRNMFEKAIEIDSGYALAYAGLADLYNSYTFDVKEDKRAIDLQQKYIEKAFELNPNSARVNLVKNWVHLYKGEWDKSYESRKRALELNPDEAKNNQAMGAFLVHHGLHHQSMDFFRKAIELDPLHAEYYTWLGVTHRSVGNLQQTITDYEKALEIEPNHLYTLNNFARLFIMLERYVEAEDYLARCETINPDKHRQDVTRALLYAAKGKKEAAIEFLEAGKQSFRSITREQYFRYYKIVVYSLLGLKDEAVKLIDNKPMPPHELLNPDESDYLDILNNPLFDNLRDTDEFKAALQRAKKEYEQNLEKYREVYL